MLQAIDNSVTGSMTAQQPGFCPSAFRVATHGQQVASLGGVAVSIFYCTSRQSTHTYIYIYTHTYIYICMYVYIYCRILVNSIEYPKRPPSVILLRINRWMDTTHANELHRSILVKWANPHAVHMLLMHSLIKEVSFSWLAFQGASHCSFCITIGHVLCIFQDHFCLQAFKKKGNIIHSDLLLPRRLLPAGLNLWPTRITSAKFFFMSSLFFSLSLHPFSYQPPFFFSSIHAIIYGRPVRRLGHKGPIPPTKGDPPTSKKKTKSPSQKNGPPPDESVSSKSPPKNTPPPEQNRKTPSPHKSAPPPDQNKPNSSILKNVSSPSKNVNEKEKETTENIWKAPPKIQVDVVDLLQRARAISSQVQEHGLMFNLEEVRLDQKKRTVSVFVVDKRSKKIVKPVKDMVLRQLSSLGVKVQAIDSWHLLRFLGYTVTIWRRSRRPNTKITRK